MLRGLVLVLVGSIAFAATPEFEVASVKPLQINDPAETIDNHMPSLNVEPGRSLNFANITLRDLIMLAYGVGAPQISGPESIRNRYNVVAKVPADAKKDQVPLMLQQLLADRFKLQLHREQKTIQIFALELGKGGPKMQAVAEGDNGPAGCDRSFAERPGATLAAECHRLDSLAIAQQAQALAPGYFRDGPIIDMTGLKGTYNFKLEWVTRAEANNGSEGPTMFNAVQDQLGLKLSPRKQAVEILVIDQVEKQPTAN
jgi:uncharacterized protein (TIGR03435 family)